MITKRMKDLIEAPLANAMKINLPEGRRPAPRSPKAVIADEAGVPKLSDEQLHERKGKQRDAKLEALFDYYAKTELTVERIAEHMGLYCNEQTGTDDKGKPIMARVLDVGLVERQISWRRQRAA